MTRVYRFTDGGPGPAIAFFVTAEADYRFGRGCQGVRRGARPDRQRGTRERKTVPAPTTARARTPFR